RVSPREADRRARGARRTAAAPGLRRARASDRRAPADRAGRRGPSLRIRPALRGDRRRAGLERRGSPAGSVRGGAAPTQDPTYTEGAGMSVPTHLDRRFRDAADREGLVDVAYDVADSPVGELLVAVTERGLCRIAFRPDEAIDEIAADFGARVLRIPRRVDP